MEKSSGRTVFLLAEVSQDTRKSRGLFLCTVTCWWVRLVCCALWIVFCGREDKKKKKSCSTFSSRKRDCMYRSCSWALTVVYLSLILLEQGGRPSRTGMCCVLFLQFLVYRVKSGALCPPVLILQWLWTQPRAVLQVLSVPRWASA